MGFSLIVGGTSDRICDNIHVISRDDWGARSPTTRSGLSDPVNMFLVHHTATDTCDDVSSCSSILRGIQNYHINNKEWSDIGYSFLIGGDGQVYEGRGWGVVGAHTYNYNRRGYAVSFIGNFETTLPSTRARNAARALIQCGVDKGHINEDYTLHGHRDADRRVHPTVCPGQRLYDEISTWPHFDSNVPR
uniref:Peptidoglycan-recognition protein n=1 Tax=Argopecten irradians TaxID=31199 RepID=Q6T3U2_ARGIR|nr:peptidoglycan recognition protein [Argopecten irradians]